jgi:hypothetical protein
MFFLVFFQFIFTFISLSRFTFSLSLTLSLFRRWRGRPEAGGGAAVFSGETTPKPKLYTPNPFVFSH